MSIEELLDLIACPKCHGKLRVVDPVDAAAPEQAAGLLCDACKLLFAYEDGLPNMLINEARAWPPPQTSA